MLLVAKAGRGGLIVLFLLDDLRFQFANLDMIFVRQTTPSSSSTSQLLEY